MTGAMPFVLVGTSTLAQLFAGWAAVLPIAALALYGWLRGGFLATIAGLQVLGAFLAAVALARPLWGVVESLGCPAPQSLAVAYLLVFAAVLVGVRLAVGAAIPDGALKLAPLADHVCGLVLGAGAGFVLGGALLVGWSMADMPAWFRLDNTHQPLDSGGRVLATFARFAARDAAARAILLDGDRPAPAGEAGGLRASEPFVDANRSGTCDAGAAADAGGEPYLDLDASGGFSRDLSWQAGPDGRRRVGLRDCYRLAEWRRVRSMHAPRIESDDGGEVTENTPVEEVVYQARAVDADGDGITFAVEPVAAAEEAEGDAPDQGVAIDAATGAVTLVEPADFERAKSHEFVVVATDSTGLSARKRVRLRVRDVPLEPSATR
ncbi:MAG: Ig-like domain-containing protein [Planctomycetia bacterium]